MYILLGDGVCPSSCALEDKQVHSALHRRAGSESFSSGLLPVAVAGHDSRRRAQVLRQIRDIWIGPNTRLES